MEKIDSKMVQQILNDEEIFLDNFIWRRDKKIGV